MARISLGAVLLLTVLFAGACPSSDGGATIGGDDPEQAQLPQIKVNLPPPPSFQKEHAPEKYTDSSYSVYGLRKDLKALLNQTVRVKGFLLEVYECPPCPKGATCKTCDRPHLYLGDRANSPKEESLMVVDYPTEDPTTKKKMTFDVGIQYYFSGTFSRTSSTGFSNSDGLLIWAESKKVSE